MKILSFDVGIINLAYCIIETVPEPKILHWEIITINETAKNFTAHVSSSGVSELYINLIKQLDLRPVLLETDIVLIEKQPSFNPKMRIIAGCLQTYFYIRGVVDRKINPINSVEFFSPKNKLKCYTGPELDISSKNGKIVKGKYAQTKKMGVAIARVKLECYSETGFLTLFENSKKKDDLSDCYLQALTYLSFKTAKPVNLKKPKGPKEQNEPKETLKEQKETLKKFLDKSLKVCSVMEIMEHDFKTIHELVFPFEITNIEETLNKLNLKKYKLFKYKLTCS